MIKRESRARIEGTNSRKILKEAGEILGVSPEEVPRTVKKLLEEARKLDERIKSLEKNL